MNLFSLSQVTEKNFEVLEAITGSLSEIKEKVQTPIPQLRSLKKYLNEIRDALQVLDADDQLEQTLSLEVYLRYSNDVLHGRVIDFLIASLFAVGME